MAAALKGGQATVTDDETDKHKGGGSKGRSSKAAIEPMTVGHRNNVRLDVRGTSVSTSAYLDLLPMHSQNTLRMII